MTTDHDDPGRELAGQTWHTALKDAGLTRVGPNLELGAAYQGAGVAGHLDLVSTMREQTVPSAYLWAGTWDDHDTATHVAVTRPQDIDDAVRTLQGP